MSSQPAADHDDYELDPVFLNSKREALVIFGVWFLCMIWTVPVSYMLGYGQHVTPGDVSTVMGIPTWTFWGVVFPWLIADVITTWFCFRFLKEDALDDSEEDQVATAPTTEGETA